MYSSLIQLYEVTAVILPVLRMAPILQTSLFNINLGLYGELPEHSGFSIYGDKDSSIHFPPSNIQHFSEHLLAFPSPISKKQPLVANSTSWRPWLQAQAKKKLAESIMKKKKTKHFLYLGGPFTSTAFVFNLPLLTPEVNFHVVLWRNFTNLSMWIPPQLPS